MSNQSTALTVVNEHDSRVIEMWLQGRASNTQKAYVHDIARLHAFAGEPLQQVTLADLQAFSDSLTDVGESS